MSFPAASKDRLTAAGDLSSGSRRVTVDDILIIAPYNAQVFDLEDRIPSARIDLRQDVGSDEVRKASRPRAADLPVPGEHTDV
jgi:hypothetical protein